MTGKLDVRAAASHIAARTEELSGPISAEDLTDELEIELALSEDNHECSPAHSY